MRTCSPAVRSSRSTEPPADRRRAGPLSRRLIVDGLNVIGSRPDGWWRDRRAAMRSLIVSLGGRGPVTVVLDGRPFDVEAPEDVEVVFAPAPGPGAADDVIVDLVGQDDDREQLEVVTSDGELARRVGALGARVVPAKRFRSLLGG